MRSDKNGEETHGILCFSRIIDTRTARMGAVHTMSITTQTKAIVGILEIQAEVG